MNPNVLLILSKNNTWEYMRIYKTKQQKKPPNIIYSGEKQPKRSIAVT
jgi:hypothetical protein